MNFSIVYTTANKAEAEEIGRQLVEDRLAACVNILDNMNSIYRWEGKIETGREAALLIKTKKDLVAKVMARVKELHSYECPAILSWSIDQGHEDYLNWLGKNMQS